MTMNELLNDIVKVWMKDDGIVLQRYARKHKYFGRKKLKLIREVQLIRLRYVAFMKEELRNDPNILIYPIYMDYTSECHRYLLELFKRL